MPLSASSIFAAVGASVNNVQFQSSAEVLPRKILIVATYDPAKTAVIDETPVLVTSDAELMRAGPVPLPSNGYEER